MNLVNTLAFLLEHLKVGREERWLNWSVGLFTAEVSRSILDSVPSTIPDSVPEMFVAYERISPRLIYRIWLPHERG